MPPDPSHPSKGPSGKTDRPTRRKRETSSTPPPRSLLQLGSDLHSAWREQLSKAKALPLALAIAAFVRSGRVNFDEHYEIVSMACEVLWDTGHDGDALKVVERLHRRVQKSARRDDSLTRDQLLAYSVRTARLWARVLHRQGDAYGAWHQIRVAYRLLCDQAGGQFGLSARAATMPFSGDGLLYAELLGIAVPVGRRLPTASRSPLWDTFMADAESIARQLRPEARDQTHFHALVSQLLFAVLEREDPASDTGLVQILYLLDSATRPRDARGQVTRHILYMAIADYFGETGRAKHFRRRGLRALAEAEMLRHVRVIEARYGPRD